MVLTDGHQLFHLSVSKRWRFPLRPLAGFSDSFLINRVWKEITVTLQSRILTNPILTKWSKLISWLLSSIHIMYLQLWCNDAGPHLLSMLPPIHHLIANIRTHQIKLNRGNVLQHTWPALFKGAERKKERESASEKEENNVKWMNLNVRLVAQLVREVLFQVTLKHRICGVHP